MTTRPYLTNLKGSSTPVPVVIEWARYLGTTFGSSGALNSLQYYEQLGWISSDVRKRMRTYVQGLSLDEIHTKKYEDFEPVEPPLAELSGTALGAHAESLRYIARIAGDDIGEAVMVTRLAESRTVDETEEERDIGFAWTAEDRAGNWPEGG